MTALPKDGRQRVVIERVTPEIDGGRFPVKRTVGESVVVEAEVFADGHDAVSCVLLFKSEDDKSWDEASMRPVGGDQWRGRFQVQNLGGYTYTILAWVDAFATWRANLARREDTEDLQVALLTGIDMIEDAARRAAPADAAWLRDRIETLRGSGAIDRRVESALEGELAGIMARYPDRRHASRYDRELTVVADRERARFSSWYELFPRSSSPESGRHGTLQDCEDRLGYVASMGFDVLYLPPIHPIGNVNRKGPNNSIIATADDPGSPWAIGAPEGGHMAVHRELGTVEDLRNLVARARDHGMEIALDVAFQCAPDHPYVQSHPEWFVWRPDGRVQFAENLPKKYQDIYPFDFESDAWQELWEELKSIVLYWYEQGVRIFRVDNPHTKPFGMWEWLLGEVRRKHPDVIFLSEAFTRPNVMYRLAKLGFNQSYNYFPWRNTKSEITHYFTELTNSTVREYFRPNLWPNTPDILPEYLQIGGRPAFMTRLVLAATLGASYGIYGPAFELAQNTPQRTGSEEYLDSEKYQIRHWNLDRPDSLRDFIARINRVRREHPALQEDWNLRFHPIDNEEMIAYSKTTDDLADIILVVVNLDPHHAHSGWVELPLADWSLDPEQPYQAHDLLSGARFLWHGHRNFVSLDPGSVPSHVLQIRRRVRSERDFDYFM